MTESGNDTLSKFTKRFAIIASKFDTFAGKKGLIITLCSTEWLRKWKHPKMQ